MKNFTLKELTEKVTKRISEYLGFDIIELFATSDYITIYGGAVRDSLADKEINDIDILCMIDSGIATVNFIKNKGFDKLDLYDIDAIRMYSQLTMISEPWTYINDKKIVQIIRPRYRFGVSDYVENYTNILKNVDFSCCGVFLELKDGEIRLKESCRNAIVHCLTKTYEKNTWAKLYESNRATIREDKLKRNGWKNIDVRSDPFIYIDEVPGIKLERLLKITSLEFRPEYSYKIWTSDEYKERKKEKDDNYCDLPF